MKKIILVLLVCFLAVGASNAQNNVAFSYSMGFGVGDVADFIKQPSFRGFSFDFRNQVTPNVGVGFTVGWNVFYEAMDKDSYSVGNSTLTGKQFRYSNHVPLFASGTYYLSPGEPFNPFVGLGIGTIYTRRNTDMNLYTIEQEAWNFGLQPEAGFQYSFDDATAAYISLKFNQGFKAGNELKSAQSYLSLNIGLVFTN